MKTACLNCLVLSCGALISSTVALHSQNYSIDWYKIAGGGGTSSNLQYAVSGTIGQQDANGPLTNAQYSVTGGFWSMFAVQTLGAPRLTIHLSATNTVIVSWPSPSNGYNLQQNSDLTNSLWANVPDPVTDDGTRKFIVVAPSRGNRFYRLTAN